MFRRSMTADLLPPPTGRHECTPVAADNSHLLFRQHGHFPPIVRLTETLLYSCGSLNFEDFNQYFTKLEPTKTRG